MSGAAEGIAGLALSTVSIAALFITCIDCYNLVVAAREFGKDHELLCTELSLQKLRFFLWGESVGLASSTSESRPRPNPGLDDPLRRATIIRTLNAIQALLSETREFRDRY
ncbi:prion-inhibition and propagation, helo domain-containing protein, partial [Hyaloscypha finlandica]